MSEQKMESAPIEKPSRKDKFFEVIKQLELSDHQKLVLKERWADQTSWYGSKARYAKKRRNILRIILIISGALLPAVPTLDNYFSPIGGADGINISMIATSLLGIIVAVTAGLESFLDYQDDYNRYREAAELLKIEGWSYLSLSGVYKRYTSHDKAYERFCERVEEIIRREIKAFSEAQDRREEEQES